MPQTQFKQLLHKCIIITVLFSGWQALVWFFKIPPYILPSPVEVLNIFYREPLLLMQQTLPTLSETLIGFGAGVMIGIFSALLLSWFTLLRTWLLPLLIVSQALPTFAIAPLFILWFGYGAASKILICMLMIYFPITSSAYDGLRTTKTAWLDMAHVMQATRFNKVWHLQFRAALPHIAAGIRLASVYAPMGAIIGEWVGAGNGLGFLMLSANARLQIDEMFAALIIILIFSLTLYFFVDRLLQYLVPWHSVTQS